MLKKSKQTTIIRSMENKIATITVTEETIKNKIYIVRGQKVMFDFDLAELYGYETRSFNQQVKRNIDKFPNDFMFKLTKDELDEIMMSQNVISPNNNYFSGQSGGTRKLPYAFTEQGIYMLMTILKGELATKQSIAIIRLFKAMKDYIVETKPLLDSMNRYIENKFSSYDKRFEAVEHKLDAVMDNFIDPSTYKEFLIFNGQKIESDVAFKNIFSLANKSLYLIDDYVGLKTLELLKHCRQGIKIIIFSDNVSRPKLSFSFVGDFKKDRPDIDISFKKTNNRVHDRYIAIDIGDSFKLFHSGASSKDGGNKITTIMEIEEPLKYKELFDELLLNEELIFE